VARSSIRRLQRCRLYRIWWSPLARYLVDRIIRYVFIARRELLPTASEAGRQPFCEANQDQHDHSAREQYAEDDNTCCQVRMSRQVFAEPPGTPGVCGSRATAWLQRCRSQMAGANTMAAPRTTRRPASRSCLTGLLRTGGSLLSAVLEKHPGRVNVHCSLVPSSMSGLIAARYSCCSAMCCSRLAAWGAVLALSSQNESRAASIASLSMTSGSESRLCSR
jgi:hypothetical protein